MGESQCPLCHAITPHDHGMKGEAFIKMQAAYWNHILQEQLADSQKREPN